MVRRSAFLVMLLVFSAALALRLFRLDAQSLWLDEGGTWSEATGRSWAALFGDLWSPRASYPLYHLLMKGWLTLAGDSPWMLRFPSAVAGAGAVLLIYLLGRRLGYVRVGAWAAGLLLLHPVALFQSQDAKVYSALSALTVGSLVLLVGALQTRQRGYWLAWMGSIVLGLMLHRLSLLSVIGQTLLLAVYVDWRGLRRWLLWATPTVLTVALIVGLTRGLRQDPHAPPVGISTDPLTAAWLLLGRLLLDRASGDVLLVLLPFMLVLIAGGWQVWQLWRAGQRLPGLVLLCGALVPLLIYLGLLGFGTPIFESRYVSFIVPLVLLLLGFGLEALWQRLAASYAAAVSVGAAAALLGAQLWAVFTGPYGVWSGVAVKEDYKAAVTRLAQRVAPDDTVVVHPPYIAPLYRYYAERVTPDPLPEPRAFGRAGALGYAQGEFDNDYAALLSGHQRAWLLIAPLNAAFIDPPNPAYPQDDMGKVGINFLTADLNQKWRCVDEQYWAFNGLRILCQSFPRQLTAGSLEMREPWPVPQSDTAVWANSIELLGYALRPWNADASVQAGGTLPLELHWRTTRPLEQRYRLFVHLVPELGAKVAAQADVEPLYGGLPTSQWPPEQPIHDAVAVPLPADMAAGSYLVVAGWYDPTIAGVEAQRIAVAETTMPAGDSYVVLGTIEVRP